MNYDSRDSLPIFIIQKLFVSDRCRNVFIERTLSGWSKEATLFSGQVGVSLCKVNKRGRGTRVSLNRNFTVDRGGGYRQLTCNSLLMYRCFCRVGCLVNIKTEKFWVTPFVILKYF